MDLNCPLVLPPPLFFSFENILTNEEQRTEYKNRDIITFLKIKLEICFAYHLNFHPKIRLCAEQLNEGHLCMQFAYYWPSINNECILACLGYSVLV